ncbi:TPA: glycosyltransferase [Proteus mirabilis]
MIQENKNAYPLVSIIISTYNRKNLLKRAITSAIKQDYPNIEIIISDDNSLDDNEEMIENIKKQTTIPIFYIKNKKNMGACFTRNQGIKIASGKYIAGLDDDEFTPNRISLLVKNYNPKYSLITSNSILITKNKKYNLFKDKKAKIISFKDSLWENQVGTQCLVESERIRNCNGFDTNLTSAQDADMWIRLIQKYGNALRLPQVTYLIHTEHENNRISTSAKKITGLITYYKKHEPHMSSGQKSYMNFKIHYWKNKKITFKSLFLLTPSSIFHILSVFFKRK